MKPVVSNRIIFILIALGSSFLVTGCDSSESNPQSAAPPAPEVGVVIIKPQDLMLSTELAGRTTPFLIAEVRPQVSGIIQRRGFEEGSEVKQGQSLYQIDPASYQASHDVARAVLARDEAMLNTAELKLRRYKELIASKAISQEAFDEADAASKQAKATVAMDKAAVKSAQINLAYTEIRAPIAGRIGRSSVTQGALVTASQSAALATIQQLDPIYVDLNQSSADLLRLKRALSDGDLKRPDNAALSISLILADGSQYAHQGELQFTEVSVDEITGTVTLRAKFPNPDQLLLPGMFVRAMVEEGVRSDAILAPQQAVTRDARGNAIAMVLNPDNKVEARTLVTERAVGNQWLISQGLAAGDRLIVDGLQKIRPGAEARAVILPDPAGAVSSAQTK
jgi:membrane fusion protein (multidrug efflux system)